jgi:hypothetical protein
MAKCKSSKRRNMKVSWSSCGWRPHWEPEQLASARQGRTYYVESIKDTLRYVAAQPRYGDLAILAEVALRVIVQLQTEKHEARLRVSLEIEQIGAGEHLRAALKLLERLEKVEVKHG